MQAAKQFEETQRAKKKAEAALRAEQDAEFKTQRAARLKAKNDLAEQEKLARQTGEVVKEKKDAFKNKFAMFEKKEGPSEEEKIKSGIVKASQGRRFEKQMKSVMAENTGANPLAMEMMLRAKIGNTTVHTSNESEEQSFEAAGRRGSSFHDENVEDAGEINHLANLNPMALAQHLAKVKVEEINNHPQPKQEKDQGWSKQLVESLVEGGEEGLGGEQAEEDKFWTVCDQEGDVYYWNSKTEVSTYEKPPCMYDQAWQRIEDESGLYFWNVFSNDTTFERPAEFTEELNRPQTERGGEVEVYAEAEPELEPEPEPELETEADPKLETETEAETKMWQSSGIDEEGNEIFVCAETGESVKKQPTGTVLIAFPDGSMWQVYESEDGKTQYTNTTTDEVSSVKPEGGAVVIVET